jgi:glycosyltransferase involved in cell wall biosynthesis
VAESIRWCGVVPDAGALFSAFDVFVLSSRTEGIPVVLLEAMAAQTPIVAARAGGVPEMLSDEEALLVAVDNPHALAVAMTEVRDNPAAAVVRATAARARLERDFVLDEWVKRYDRVYRSVLGDPPPPGQRR